MSLVSPFEDVGKLVQEDNTKDLNVVSIDFGFGKSFRTAFLFGVGQSKLVRAHINWLQENAVEMLQSDDAVVELYGIASSTASDAFNMELSGKRLVSVVSELRHQGVSGVRLAQPPNQFIALGESFARSLEDDNVEDRFMRAAVMFLWPDAVTHAVVFADNKLLQFVRKKTTR